MTITELLHTGNIDGACDAIVAMAWDGTDITRTMADEWMHVVHVYDPRECGDAAQLRDTIRDNTELDMS